MSLFDPKLYEDKTYENPMVYKHGKGPEGRKCKECQRFYYKQYETNILNVSTEEIQLARALITKPIGMHVAGLRRKKNGIKAAVFN